MAKKLKFKEGDKVYVSGWGKTIGTITKVDPEDTLFTYKVKMDGQGHDGCWRHNAELTLVGAE